MRVISLPYIINANFFLLAVTHVHWIEVFKIVIGCDCNFKETFRILYMLSIVNLLGYASLAYWACARVIAFQREA